MLDTVKSAGKSDQQSLLSGLLTGDQPTPDDASGQFQGMGPILEDPDPDVFKDTEAMIRRQDLLFLNRWNQDEYYKTVLDGYPWATLIHDVGTNRYEFELPYGVNQLSIQPIPNKNLDLVNKTSEQLLVDFPQADAEPLDDSEAAENAADMADRFLAQDSGEQGTNDAVLFDDRVKLALATASSFVEVWVDQTGGGYVPLQIEAHPQAVSPDQPLVGPDGMPTTDLVLRYVTAPQGGQFTNDPSKAAPQWQAKMRGSKWERAHIRTFPEALPVEQAQQVIVLGYCTLDEGKRRWQEVAQMAPEDLSALCDWTPPRYLQLLPPFQQSRWKLSDGKSRNKMGASDERLMFYYHRFIKACPDYPKGADVVMTGLDGGQILHKDLLAVEVSVDASEGSETTGPVQETRCLEIPLVQITPRQDPTGQDPTGKCYMSLFVGATENNAVLAQGYSAILQKILHMPWGVSSTSSIEKADFDAAMMSGDMLSYVQGQVDQLPRQLTPPVAPNGFFQMFEVSDEAINSIASRERASTGQDTSKERSGKAIQIAVAQNNIGNTSMLTAVNNSYARFNRLKLEQAMAKFTTTQQVAYVGEDGAHQMMDLHAMDFALIGKVVTKAGTGTGLTPDNKVQYQANLVAEGFLDRDEAAEAARPIFSRRLGLPANPFEQYVSRCIDTWLDGPPAPDQTPDPITGQPKPDWTTQYRSWMQATQQYEQAMQQFQQQQMAQQSYFQAKATTMAGAPSGMLGPEGQEAQDARTYQQAMIAVQLAEMQNPAIGQPLQPPQAPQVQKPWVPFSQRPNDTEPKISTLWTRKLSKVMSSVDYLRWGPEWADVLTRQYTAMRQAAATGAAAQQAQNPSSTGRAARTHAQQSQGPTQSPPTPTGAH